MLDAAPISCPLSVDVDFAVIVIFAKKEQTVSFKESIFLSSFLMIDVSDVDFAKEESGNFSSGSSVSLNSSLLKKMFSEPAAPSSSISGKNGVEDKMFEDALETS